VKKTIIFIFILGIAPLQARAGNVVVRFETHASTLSPYTSIFIAGSFNNWSPSDSGYILHSIDKDNYTIELTLPDGKPIEYKYTLGGWEGVEKKSDGADRDNRRFIAAKGHVQKDTVVSWAIDAVNRGEWFPEDLSVYQINILNKEFRQEQREANTTADFDTLIAKLQSRWNQELAAHFGNGVWPINARANSQTTMHQTAGATLASQVYDYMLLKDAGLESNRNVFDYVVSTYWLPAFLDEYSYYAHVPSLIRLANWLPGSQNLLNSVLYTQLPKTEWDKIYAIHNNIFALMDTCLSQVSLKRSGISQVIQMQKEFLQESRNFWDINNALYSGNTNAARECLARYLKTDTTYKLSGGNFALKVVNRYIEEKQNEEACKTLDMLLAQTNDSFIPRDTIRTYYIEADPSGGLSRFERAVLHRRKFTLASKDSVHKFSGTYRNILSGNDISLDSLRGKIVLVDVWTTSCTGCRAELPALKTFAEKNKDRKDFILVTICGDLVEQVRNEAGIKAFVDEFKLTYPILLDIPSRSFIRDFNVHLFPAKFLFDADGNLLMRSEDGLSLETVEAYLANRDLK
jgi:thiol-disulfide isomerase/thioredoxin